MTPSIHRTKSYDVLWEPTLDTENYDQELVEVPERPKFNPRIILPSRDDIKHQFSKPQQLNSLRLSDEQEAYLEYQLTRKEDYFKERFMKEVRQKQFAHIYKAEIPQKKS